MCEQYPYHTPPSIKWVGLTLAGAKTRDTPFLAGREKCHGGVPVRHVQLTHTTMLFGVSWQHLSPAFCLHVLTRRIFHCVCYGNSVREALPCMHIARAILAQPSSFWHENLILGDKLYTVGQHRGVEYIIGGRRNLCSLPRGKSCFCCNCNIPKRIYFRTAIEMLSPCPCPCKYINSASYLLTIGMQSSGEKMSANPYNRY